ncbi:hypothetical protein [Kribbella deserti]|uniref:Uncharacterized protein n=1 Tax=Kribbella deserti TaxID=1926257 RepID=A0ABV6QCR3_9ACTN
MTSQRELTRPIAARAMRVPGTSRPREEILKEVAEYNAGFEGPFKLLLGHDPNKLYLWRIQLDCGCVEECLTYGEPPTERATRDFLNGGLIQAGQRLCSSTHGAPPCYSTIETWDDRREETFPPDPIEPKYDMSHEEWQLFRKDHEYSFAFWTVTLTCRHQTEICTDLGWRPEDKLRRLSPDRLRKMRDGFESYWESEPTEDVAEQAHREHRRRMLNDGWPRPEPEQECSTCRRVRWIVGYQAIGWLVPRPKPPKPKPSKRVQLTRKLAKLEAEVAQLRRELDTLE